MRAVKVPRLEEGSIGPRAQSLGKWDGPMAMVPCLHQGTHLYQKEATGMERPVMYSVIRCNNPTYPYGPSKYTVSREVGIGHCTES